VDIRKQFGQRVRELRARSGMSQETLAFRSELDRTYISGVERGERNISLQNIERIAKALQVSLEYLFSGERFTANPTYRQKDFAVPFQERFRYGLDNEKKVLSFQVKGILSAENVVHMDTTLIGLCSAFGKGELNILVDHREMLDASGKPVVYSPDVAEKAVQFQQRLMTFSNQVVVLCNSEFMVQQLNHVTSESGIRRSTHLFGEDRHMVGEAYHLLDIRGSELVKTLG